jgi:hypothetical protein
MAATEFARWYIEATCVGLIDHPVTAGCVPLESGWRGSSSGEFMIAPTAAQWLKLPHRGIYAIEHYANSTRCAYSCSRTLNIDLSEPRPWATFVPEPTRILAD